MNRQPGTTQLDAPTLRLGSQGKVVKQLQRRLQANFYYSNSHTCEVQ